MMPRRTLLVAAMLALRGLARVVVAEDMGPAAFVWPP
jgi:hypothetical protein